MAFCVKCGAQLAENASFCPACGTQQGAAAAGAASGTGDKVGSLDVNIAGALAYLWIVGILFLILEPYNKNRFVRFHSFQAIGLGVVWFVVNVALLIVPFLGWVASGLWGLVMLLAWLVCIFKAFNKEMFKLPVLGDFAEKQAGA